MLSYLKEHIRQEQNAEFTTESLSRAKGDDAVKSVFLDTVGGSILGAENDETIDALINKIPEYNPGDENLEKEIESHVKESVFETEYESVEEGLKLKDRFKVSISHFKSLSFGEKVLSLITSIPSFIDVVDTVVPGSNSKSLFSELREYISSAKEAAKSFDDPADGKKAISAINAQITKLKSQRDRIADDVKVKNIVKQSKNRRHTIDQVLVTLESIKENAEKRLAKLEKGKTSGAKPATESTDFIPSLLDINEFDV